MQKILAAGWIALLLSGCSGSAPVGSDSGGKSGEVNGVPAEDFYSQYLYHRDETGAEPYRYLHSGWQPLSHIAAGDVYFDTRIFLFPSHEYLLIYHESVGNIAAGVFKPNEVFYKNFLWGSWKVEGSLLELDRAGEASAPTTAGGVALLFQYFSNVNTEGVAGQVVPMAYESSATGPDESMQDSSASSDSAWLVGHWVRKDGANASESITVQASPKRLVKEVFRWVSVDDRHGDPFMSSKDCHIRYMSDHFNLMGEVVDGKIQYVLLYQLDDVEVYGDSVNDPDCREHAKVQRMQIQTNGVWQRLDIKKESDKVFRTMGETYEKS